MEKISPDSPYWDYFPDQLKDHLTSEPLADMKVDYKLPHIGREYKELRRKDFFITKPSDVRLPARLSSPLIPYPTEVKQVCDGSYAGNTNYIHGHHFSQLKTLRDTYNALIQTKVIPDKPLEYSMDSLKKFARQSYSIRETMINLAVKSFAQRATEKDLSISACTNVPFNVPTSAVSEYTSFIIMIQRLRVHIAKNSLFIPLKDGPNVPTSDEATYTMFTNGVYLYQSVAKGRHYSLLSCGGHFRLYHESLGYWFCGPATYLDYIFTIADVLNNLDILRNTEEYVWARPMFNLLIDFSEREGFHKEQVDFMKSLEGFMLNLSDYDDAHAMNWKPLLEAVVELWSLDQTISCIKYDIGVIMPLMRRESIAYPKSSYLCKFIVEAMALSRTHRQEISALHKLIFYAEVNAQAGVEKFLKRVHTPRKIEEQAVKNLTRHAKALFLVAYRKKHRTLPNLIGPPTKIRMLETYAQKQDYRQIEAMPLSWWDDLKIFDCMDNTLTDDPLEFAKDKGALKRRIAFGPGDSRKELLQVIERENYELKDFFKSKEFKVKAPLVQWTSQKDVAEEMEDPARLIEKEKEQKYEARLFANAELENKHSLSLVTARMKKALSYFDEQLMTPSDSKRKSLLHEASRELSQQDNYSLLLDIEGHNQSMQAINTSELAEFVGNLFGFDGWSRLGAYFSQLTVYHYDEYLDKVIESHGQLGGIEGWLNPLWTMHTLLMMKLLRIMTDIDVKTIMVYSDDVNAITKIPQASEPMVKSVFAKIMSHCSKFGMTIKYSQTTLSKHRVTMLRQHYADGIRADSTLKRLMSVSACNNPVLVSDELEVSGICSSASSAMELSNHNEACCYLKNYKLGLLLARLPQTILSHVNPGSMISPDELPPALSNLLYYSKSDQEELSLSDHPNLMKAAENDILSYLGRSRGTANTQLLSTALTAIYGTGVAEMRLVDSPDRVLYLQVYDSFIQDLLFFWTYLPCNLGGLGASLHINLMLSGHSIGMTKALHYLKEWIVNYSSNPGYFLRYLSTTLSISTAHERNMEEMRLATTTWPSDGRICPALTSVQQAIKTMVHRHTKNKSIIQLFKLADDREVIARNMVEFFRSNFHVRIVQFYCENTSVHFLDLLVNKIETSSGLLSKVRDITKLRKSIVSRAIECIRMAADTSRTYYGEVQRSTDIVEFLLNRKVAMFPKIRFVEVEEILYDDKMEEIQANTALLTVRRCAPTHYRNGIRVYDDPKVGNEVLYKGELLDDDRMLGNKEELICAKLVAVTKWLLMKKNLITATIEAIQSYDVVRACNLALASLTNQKFSELFHHAPTETGGEILHRIPNIRFSTSTYIRSEMNRSLSYTTELNQRMITSMGLVDSNINFDYMRMRYLVSAIIRDKYDALRRLVMHYAFSNLTGIKDVQFVTPKETNHCASESIGCYSDLRNHKLSFMRFRYLSRSYLYEENVNDWALMPKIHEVESADVLGNRYINDIILRYSKDLDKDYMSLTPLHVDETIWAPLIKKLNKIDPTWNLDHTDDSTQEIRRRLIEVMVERSRISTVDKSNKVELALQSKCLEVIREISPQDSEYYTLAQRYSMTAQNRRHSSKLSVRLAKYQQALSNLEAKRTSLTDSLIFEYITVFHFKVKRSHMEIEIDAEESFREFLSEGVGGLSFMAIHPELQTRLLILGREFVEVYARDKQQVLLEAYREICSEISISDIMMPSDLPSLEPETILRVSEDLPLIRYEIEYEMTKLPPGAMSTLDEIGPLCKYASKCSTIGAHPAIYSSPTGSDSFCAQYGLFRMLVAHGHVDQNTEICDLTAGRGDGLYALQDLGLKATSYSRKDTFTRIYHHPEVNFGVEYDIFKGQTLKFITGYDFVHIDVSFTGSDDGKILDLIMMLEENNLAYSIRLNSVDCSGYSNDITADLPTYDHYIAYAMNKEYRPYQIYLIGFPNQARKEPGSVKFKQTIAFKSIALGFSKLLDPALLSNRLHDWQRNSASMCLPNRGEIKSYIEYVCDNSVADEQRYYLNRYLAEIGEGALIEFSYNLMDKRIQNACERRTHHFSIEPNTGYSALSKGMIGNVSHGSRPYHEDHVQALIDGRTPVWKIKILDCDDEFLELLRVHHPIQEIRSWCNIMLGLSKFCRGALLSGHDSLVDLSQQLKNDKPQSMSMHQREIHLAIKLLVLAVRSGDYTYGSRYCARIQATRGLPVRTILNTAKIYRLLSFLYDDIRLMMQRGLICIRSLEALHNELEIRETIKYKYKKSTNDLDLADTAAGMIMPEIDFDFDSLFSSLEKFAMQQTSVVDENQGTTDIDTSTAIGSLEFNMNIEEIVNEAIDRLGLKPSGPRGIIDLGDEDIPDDPDW